VQCDPYEVAYLRGGGNELLRYTVFDLVRSGFLRVGEPPKPNKPPDRLVATGLGSGALSPLADQVVAFYQTPHTATELFASPLPEAAKEWGAANFDAKLRGGRLLAGPEIAAAAARVRLYGGIALAALALYRLANAFVKHHNNVILLIVEAILAFFALALATRPPRLSAYGRSYLDRLATAVRPTSAAPLAAGAGILPILVATTGFAALAGTEYGPIVPLFPRSAERNNASGSCSGGCGSASSSGGGGDSGGGGGCGGGCGG
jgi:uncharacterized protein (TIGR04222 family)